MKQYTYKIDDVTIPIIIESEDGIYDVLMQICKKMTFAFKVESTIFHSDGVNVTFNGILLVYKSEEDKTSRRSSIRIKDIT